MLRTRCQQLGKGASATVGQEYACSGSEHCVHHNEAKTLTAQLHQGLDIKAIHACYEVAGVHAYCALPCKLYDVSLEQHFWIV